MPPDDPTPLGDAMTHRFPQQKIPEFEPGSAEARQRGGQRCRIIRGRWSPTWATMPVGSGRRSARLSTGSNRRLGSGGRR